MNLVIETQNLSKHYGDVHAVENLSCGLAEGEIYAFLGLNGAGKTTTIRMLLGMIQPSAGSVRRAGKRGCAWAAASRGPRWATWSRCRTPTLS